MRYELCQIIEKSVRSTANLKIEKNPPILLSTPPQKQFGDFSSNIAMVLAKDLKLKPRDLAQVIVDSIQKTDKGKNIKKLEIAGPGFINLFLTDEFLKNNLEEVLKEKEKYGSSRVGEGKSILLEFVSANPTGPLHIGHGRWAAIGDSLANILDATGFKTTREFYVNDRGTQINLLVESVKARAEGSEIPEGGYGGWYVKELADQLKIINKDTIIPLVLNQQKKVMESLNVTFNSWFSEQKMHDKGEVEEALKQLKKLNHSYEKDGAVWFKSTDFGDDKDRVLVKSDGELTYFASDVAYHLDKFKRGFDHIINIFGADHHGYVKRIKAAIVGLGYDTSKFEVILGQLVSLYRGQEQVRMSKRTGEMITLEEVVEEIGTDATRYFLIMRGADTHLDFDLELAKKTTMDNPVYYVQYAHARICSIFREAKEMGFNLQLTTYNLQLLKEEAERDLMRKIADFPDEIAEAAQSRLPHRLTIYVQELVTIFHSYYHKCRVLSEDKQLSHARLALCEATRIIIKNTLNLLGVSAPEKM
jgi:arginyl-tRNA synthetase